MIACVWFAFVPRTLWFDATGLRVKFSFRPLHLLAWDDLTHWSNTGSLLRLQFRTGSLQIYTRAFAK